MQKQNRCLNFTLPLCLITLYFALHVHSAGLDTLELVQILHRHGYKNPESVYPNDPYKNENFWPGGWAQLTDVGVTQTYELGLFIRNRYGNFISDKYDQYEIYVVSSDTERTIRSGLSTLTGLYNIDNGNGISTTYSNGLVNWDHVPIRTISSTKDNILKREKVCPKFEDAYNEFIRNSDFMNPINDENKALFEYISQHSGLNITFLNKKLADFHDALVFEDNMKYSLPNWTLPIYNSERILNLVDLAFTLRTHNIEFQRFSTGPLLRLIRDNLNAKTKKGTKSASQLSSLFPEMHDSRRKMIIFSGHDTIMSSLIDTMSVFYTRPPFASALMLELYKNATSGHHYLELWYRNETERDPYFLPLETNPDKSINFPISLEDFMSKIEPIIPDDWIKECNYVVTGPTETKVLTKQNGEGNTQFFVGSLFGASIFLLGLVLLKCVQFTPNKMKKEYISYI